AVDVPSSMVHEEDIAAVAAAALTGDGHAGATHMVTGPQALTVRDKARILGEALGRPIRVVELSIEELQQGWRAEGFGEDDIAFFTAMTTERPEAGRTVLPTVLPTVRQVTGRSPRTGPRRTPGPSADPAGSAPSLSPPRARRRSGPGADRPWRGRPRPGRCRAAGRCGAAGSPRRRSPRRRRGGLRCGWPWRARPPPRRGRRCTRAA